MVLRQVASSDGGCKGGQSARWLRLCCPSLPLLLFLCTVSGVPRSLPFLARTQKKRSQKEPKGAKRSRNGAKRSRNGPKSSFSGWGRGSEGGCKRKRKSLVQSHRGSRPRGRKSSKKSQKWQLFKVFSGFGLFRAFLTPRPRGPRDPFLDFLRTFLGRGLFDPVEGQRSPNCSHKFARKWPFFPNFIVKMAPKNGTKFCAPFWSFMLFEPSFSNQKFPYFQQVGPNIRAKLWLKISLGAIHYLQNFEKANSKVNLGWSIYMNTHAKHHLSQLIPLRKRKRQNSWVELVSL